MEGHTIYFNDGDWRLVIGAKLGHGAATGEPRAGRCQVEREDGRTSEVKSAAWRQANVIYRQ